MKGRKSLTDKQYRMIKHICNRYVYAATTRTIIKNGKKISQYVHWGILKDENIFIPNLNFEMLSIDEQRKFIFPEDWNLTNVHSRKFNYNASELTINKNDKFDNFFIDLYNSFNLSSRKNNENTQLLSQNNYTNTTADLNYHDNNSHNDITSKQLETQQLNNINCKLPVQNQYQLSLLNDDESNITINSNSSNIYTVKYNNDLSDVTIYNIKFENNNKKSMVNNSHENIDNHEYQNRLYGSVWFLLQIAEQYGIIEDLRIVFEYNDNIVNDILTLAIFPYLTKFNFNHTASWQKYTKTPSNRKLTSSFITRFTQKISDNKRMEFIKLRLERQPEGSYVACDSTTRSAWGECIAEIHWGYNKDNPKLKNTLEVVVYSLTTHEPVYYATFPGNMIDARTLRTIRADLLALDLKNIIFVFDRGYESSNNIGDLIKDNIPFVMCSKISHKIISQFIDTIKYDKFGIPINMEFDEESSLYCAQFDINDKTYQATDGSYIKAYNHKCNLYLNLHKRVDQVYSINKEINLEFLEYTTLIKNKDIEEKYKYYNKRLKYHTIEKNVTKMIMKFLYYLEIQKK